ncbi:MAG: fibronectin/fibrinogen-binding protein [Chloroflexi bacterium]|nr:fibronectin/fibrinogen-binding protein [Chloroflexota bacterium]
MYYDSLTLAALRDELADRLVGGRVQRVLRPSPLAIGLEVYAGERHQLLLSAEAQSPGILLTEAKLRRGVESPSPLQFLLLKHVRGARLEAVEQPPLERILRLRFHGEHGVVTLVCEIMGRLSNLILVDAAAEIMDAAKRVPASMNRYRVILPRAPYVPPPPQEKEHPLLLTPNLLRQTIEAEADQPLWRRLVQAAAGVSPLAAKEVIYRATGELAPQMPLPDASYAAIVVALGELFRLPESHAWRPCVAYEEDSDGLLAVAYAPYTLTQYEHREPVPSISGAIRLVTEAQGRFDAYARARGRLLGIVQEQLDRQRARLASLQASCPPETEIAELQFRATAILSMAWAIQPGQEELAVNPADYGRPALDGDGLVHIPLDPSLTPAENAQRLFRDRDKLKAAAERVPPLIEETKLEIAYLEQVGVEISLAEERSQLDAIEGALHDAGYLGARDKTRASPPAEPLRLRSVDGALILVGRNSRQNDEVTFRLGDPEDIWLHAHAVPGAHVIVKRAGAALSDRTLLQAAQLAAYYSAARDQARVQVDYTEWRHVRRIRGARPGMVTYTHEETVVVTPSAASESGYDAVED